MKMGKVSLYTTINAGSNFYDADALITTADFNAIDCCDDDYDSQEDQRNECISSMIGCNVDDLLIHDGWDTMCFLVEDTNTQTYYITQYDE